MNTFLGSPDDEIIRKRKDVKYYGMLRKLTKRLARKDMTFAGLLSTNAAHITNLLFSGREDSLKRVVNCEHDVSIFEALKHEAIEVKPYELSHQSGDVFHVFGDKQWAGKVDVLDIDLMCTPTNELIEKAYSTATNCMVRNKVSVFAINTVAQRQITVIEAHGQLGKLTGWFLENDQLVDVVRTRYLGNNCTSMLGAGFVLKMNRKRIIRREIHENRTSFIEDFGTRTFLALACIVRFGKFPVRYKYSIAQKNHEHVRRGYSGQIKQGTYRPYLFLDDEGKMVDNLHLDEVKLEEYVNR